MDETPTGGHAHIQWKGTLDTCIDFTCPGCSVFAHFCVHYGAEGQPGLFGGKVRCPGCDKDWYLQPELTIRPVPDWAADDQPWTADPEPDLGEPVDLSGFPAHAVLGHSHHRHPDDAPTVTMRFPGIVPPQHFGPS